jgi:hypothetical protein
MGRAAAAAEAVAAAAVVAVSILHMVKEASFVTITHV